MLINSSATAISRTPSCLFQNATTATASATASRLTAAARLSAATPSAVSAASADVKAHIRAYNDRLITNQNHNNHGLLNIKSNHQYRTFSNTTPLHNSSNFNASNNALQYSNNHCYGADSLHCNDVSSNARSNATATFLNTLLLSNSLNAPNSLYRSPNASPTTCRSLSPLLPTAVINSCNGSVNSNNAINGSNGRNSVLTLLQNSSQLLSGNVSNLPLSCNPSTGSYSPLTTPNNPSNTSNPNNTSNTSNNNNTSGNTASSAVATSCLVTPLLEDGQVSRLSQVASELVTALPKPVARRDAIANNKKKMASELEVRMPLYYLPSN